MTIREMASSDVQFALDCTNAEGWLGETRDVFEAFLAHDAGGCFVAERESQPIGLCVATGYDTSGFIGELIVVKEMRGRGYGRKLFERSIEYLKRKGIENIFLDGDLPAVPFYERIGFKRVCQSLRFAGTIEGERSELVRRAGPADVDTICRIDRDLFGDDRSFFLRRRLRRFPQLNFILEIDRRVCGYLMARPGVGVLSVGPFAVVDSDERPDVLLKAIALDTHGQPLRIGVLESNPDAVALFESFGSFEQQTPCWRMVLGPSSVLGTNKSLYAIGSAAKG